MLCISFLSFGIIVACCDRVCSLCCSWSSVRGIQQYRAGAGVAFCECPLKNVRKFMRGMVLERLQCVWYVQTNTRHTVWHPTEDRHGRTVHLSWYMGQDGGRQLDLSWQSCIILATDIQERSLRRPKAPLLLIQYKASHSWNKVNTGIVEADIHTHDGLS